MESKPTTIARPAAGRSPSYPMLSLPEAIERVRIMWDKQRKNAVSPTVAMQALGYTGSSGTSKRIIAALIQYGLLAEEGKGDNRTVRITDEGRAIAMLEPGDPEREKATKAAALRPRIFAEMAARWPETLPLEAEMRRYLTFNKNYNQDTVHEVIKSFKRTYEYAGLGGEETRPDERGTAGEKPEEHTGPTRRAVDGAHGTGSGRDEQGYAARVMPPTNDVRAYTLPLAGGRVAYLQVPPGMSQHDFKLLTLGLRLIEASIVDTVDIPDFKILEPPKIQKGPAIWRAQDTDQPVVVTGYLGIKGDRHYVSIDGSTAGIPLDEISYDAEQG